MKDLREYVTELMNETQNNTIETVQEANETIKDEKAFREYAEAKLKEVFGEEYDEDKANEMVDGILKDNAELVEKEDWGALVGILNKGVAK